MVPSEHPGQVQVVGSWFGLDTNTFDKRSLQGDVEFLQSL